MFRVNQHCLLVVQLDLSIKHLYLTFLLLLLSFFIYIVLSISQEFLPLVLLINLSLKEYPTLILLCTLSKTINI